MMADIFNNFDRNAENRFMTALEERNREVAERIKALMFIFEDLSASTRPASRPCCARREGPAGHGPEGRLGCHRELFFKNMSERAAKIMREDMDAWARSSEGRRPGPEHIVVLAKELAVSGQIVISEGREEDELVYSMAKLQKYLFDMDFGAPIPALLPKPWSRTISTAWQRSPRKPPAAADFFGRRIGSGP